MTQDQAVVVAVLAATLGLFIWGRWRYDVVALIALLSLVLTDIVPGETAFVGFGHPAVVTVAAVLVVSRGLQNSGMVDMLARWLSHAGGRPTAQVASSTGLVAVLSGFMNNIGALATHYRRSISFAQVIDQQSFERIHLYPVIVCEEGIEQIDPLGH